MIYTTTRARVAEIIEIQNRRNPDWVYDADGFRICPVCGERRETRLPDDDPHIFGELRDLYTKGKLPILCSCGHSW